MQRPRNSILFSLVALSILLRLLPFALHRLFGISIDRNTTVYPWNFSPLMPICLFCGAFFAKRWHAFLVIFLAHLIGDIGIGLLLGDMSKGFYPMQPVTYASYALLIATGFLLRDNRSIVRIAGAGVLGATAFFVLSNFAVWGFGGGVRYPHTAEGLWECYVAAIPFYRNSLISMAVFLPVLFSRLTVFETSPESKPELAAQTG